MSRHTCHYISLITVSKHVRHEDVAEGLIRTKRIASARRTSEASRCIFPALLTRATSDLRAQPHSKFSHVALPCLPSSTVLTTTFLLLDSFGLCGLQF